jgi:hypothetical protein
MSDILPFLERLGLDQGAAAADIRRAYARELKLIDQEHDGAAFQRLREAYDTAMTWAKWCAAPAQTPLDTPPADAVFPARTRSQVDPHALASAVLARFTAHFAVTMAGDVEPDLSSCQCLLERALDDDALLNLSAGMQFEVLMAQLLAAGWKRGHEVLFVAACRLFDWHDDRRRLFELGPAGEQLSRAIDERAMFDLQSGQDIMAQRDVVARLRNPVRPSDRELVRGMRHLDELVARFPVWLKLVTDVSNIAQWRELDLQVPAWRRTRSSGEQKAAKRADGGSLGSDMGIIVAIAMIICLFSIVIQHTPSTP